MRLASLRCTPTSLALDKLALRSCVPTNIALLRSTSDRSLSASLACDRFALALCFGPCLGVANHKAWSTIICWSRLLFKSVISLIMGLLLFI